MEMFLAKAGRPVGDNDGENPYPSPTSDHHRAPLAPTQELHLDSNGLESSLVALFLGGEKISESGLNSTAPRKRRTKRKMSRPEKDQQQQQQQTSNTPAPTPAPTSSTPATHRELPAAPSKTISHVQERPRRSPVPPVQEAQKSHSPAAQLA